MTRRIWIAALGLFLASPLSAQMSGMSSGMEMRVDRSTDASDPDDTPDVKFTTVANGFEVGTGPAVVVFNPENQANGTYTLKARFTLLQPSGHTNYYGLVFGGSDLQGAAQKYLYFLVAQDGTYLVKWREGEQTGMVHDKTPSDAVMKPDANGQAVNNLEVRVKADAVDFVVNGTVVASQPKTGRAAMTDGIYGARINHVMPGVRVEGLSLAN